MMDYPVSGDPAAHLPVLYQEIIHSLKPHRGGRYVDGTVGAGGHAAGILEASSPDGFLLGMDVDPVALELARQRLTPFQDRVILIQASYTTLAKQVKNLEWEKVDGILLDLGVSSMQLDQAERGFSFRESANLDMRFDPGNPVTASQLINELPEDELANIIYRYGEERKSRQIARAIVRERPIRTTTELAEIVRRVVRSEKPGRHPATRTFQALRIAVNNELTALEEVLPQAIAVLASGGRLAVITFHSLEDRIVKQFFRRESKDCICPPRQPVCTCGHTAVIQEVSRRPIEPGETEISTNPRARSARLRVAQKL
jgi:16S rRNA (cytosine1402-N4)-methyltransferase